MNTQDKGYVLSSTQSYKYNNVTKVYIFMYKHTFCLNSAKC